MGYREENMKKVLFLENAKLLRKKFGIVPLLYGSVGLWYITGESFRTEDIDILIPAALLHEKWDEFKNELEKEGYILTDAHEHTFLKNGVYYSYAPIEELESFAGIKMEEIAQKCEEDVRFKLLSLSQYLKVYQASRKDGYRMCVRQKKDDEKIACIQKYLDNRNL